MSTESMNTELLWQQMQKDWQSAQPTVDVSTLARQINRKRRCMIVDMVAGIVVALAITGRLAYWMFANQWAVAPLAIQLAFLWILIFTVLWNRRGTWCAQGQDTRSLLRLVERRARAGIRYAWAVAIGVWAAFALASPWQWHLWLHQAQTPNGWILAPVIVIAGVNIGAIWYRQRQLRKLQRARVLLEQLSREDRNP